jgi:hypothetical protein
VGIGTSSPLEKLHIGGNGNGIAFDSLGVSNSGWIKSINDYEIEVATNRGSAFGMVVGNSNFRINQGSTERMRINNTGNVGIGTSSPSATLHVHKGSSGASSQPSGNWAAKILNQTDSSTEGGLVVANRWAAAASTPFLVGSMYDGGDGFDTFLKVDGSGNVGIGTSSPAQKLHIESSSEAGIRLNNTMSNNWDITNDSNLKFTRGSTERMRIDSTGNVGIGTSSPSEKLYVSGNIYATGNVTAYSDERIKKNINEIPNALDAVDAIRGVTYTRTDTEEDSVGVIAQEVEAMFPELITENNEGMKSVNYNGLIGVLFSAVKELSAKVRKLEND